MNDLRLTDSELIYYIKQEKEEAYKLLFLRYKTKIGKIIDKYGLFSVYAKDKDYIEDIYFSSFNEAIDYYSSNRGVFYSYFCGIFKNKVYSAFNKKKCYIFNETSCSTIEEVLSDTHNYSLEEEVNRCLKILSRYDERCYRTILYWMYGLSYQEIASKMNITCKVVAYLIRRGLEYLKEGIL